MRNRFSEVVRRLIAHGVRASSGNGRDTEVMVSAAEDEPLRAPRPMLEFLQDSPLAEAVAVGDLELARDREFGRDIVS